MQSTYCVSCKKITGIKNVRVIKKRNGRLQLKSDCSVCGKKKITVRVWGIWYFIFF